MNEISNDCGVCMQQREYRWEEKQKETNEEIRTISTSEIGPILRTMMSTSTVAGGPPKSGLTLLS